MLKTKYSLQSRLIIKQPNFNYLYTKSTYGSSAFESILLQIPDWLKNQHIFQAESSKSEFYPLLITCTVYYIKEEKP